MTGNASWSNINKTHKSHFLAWEHVFQNIRHVKTVRGRPMCQWGAYRNQRAGYQMFLWPPSHVLPIPQNWEIEKFPLQVSSIRHGQNLQIGPICELIGWLWSAAMNNNLAVSSKYTNWQLEIEHNIWGRRAAWGDDLVIVVTRKSSLRYSVAPCTEEKLLLELQPKTWQYGMLMPVFSAPRVA